MSDDAAKHFDTTKPEAMNVQEGKSVTLSITLHPNGAIDFTMPASNKILSYGLLECARAQLDRMYLQAETKKSAIPSGVDGLLRRMNGRG